MKTCSKVDFLAELIGVKPHAWRQNLQGVRYCFSLNGVEVKSGAVLISEFGVGPTPIKAKHNYAELISGKLVVVNAMNEARREFIVPNLM